MAINGSGDWIGFGCSGEPGFRFCSISFEMARWFFWNRLSVSGTGQLLVWEWQSESYVFKQQGHFNNMSSLAYSPDGQHIATGGDDGKVSPKTRIRSQNRVSALVPAWRPLSRRSRCGTPPVASASSPSPSTPAASPTSPSPPAASSSSARPWTGRSEPSTCTGESPEEGPARRPVCCEIHVSLLGPRRYRNFRTFTSPRPAQFSSLAVDVSGELVSAGAQDSFQIFLWSMQTGRLLEVDPDLNSVAPMISDQV